MILLEFAITGAGLLATFATGLIIDYFVMMKQTRPK